MGTAGCEGKKWTDMGTTSTTYSNERKDAIVLMLISELRCFKQGCAPPTIYALEKHLRTVLEVPHQDASTALPLACKSDNEDFLVTLQLSLAETCKQQMRSKKHQQELMHVKQLLADVIAKINNNPSTGFLTTLFGFDDTFTADDFTCHPQYRSLRFDCMGQVNEEMLMVRLTFHSMLPA
jgi:hypothetical protein